MTLIVALMFCCHLLIFIVLVDILEAIRRLGKRDQ